MPDLRAFVEQEYEKVEDFAPTVELRSAGNLRKRFTIERSGKVIATFSTSVSLKQFFLGANGLTVKASSEVFLVDGSPFSHYSSKSAFGKPFEVRWSMERTTPAWPSPFGSGRILWGETAIEWRLDDRYQIVSFFDLRGTRVLMAVHPWRDKYADVVWHAEFDDAGVDDQLVIVTMVALYLAGLARTLSHVTP